MNGYSLVAFIALRLRSIGLCVFSPLLSQKREQILTPERQPKTPRSRVGRNTDAGAAFGHEKTQYS